MMKQQNEIYLSNPHPKYLKRDGGRDQGQTSGEVKYRDVEEGISTIFSASDRKLASNLNFMFGLFDTQSAHILCLCSERA